MQYTLQDRWKSSGIKEGDTILLHSNIKRTLMEFRRQKVLISPQDVLQSFQDVLGSKGTLLLPLFNFDFAQGIPFVFNETKSQMGAITEIARTYPNVVRTGHPIYSFAVLGYKASEFEGVDNKSAYSAESPFSILRSLGGKIGSLDLEDQDSMTFYHHVEEIMRVDYRYFKSFRGDYTDKAGIKGCREYEIYVRDIEKGILTDVNPAGELMWEAGLYTGSRPKLGSGLRLVDANKMFHFVEGIIEDGSALGKLYTIGK